MGIRLGALEKMKTELGRELARQKEEKTVFQTTKSNRAKGMEQGRPYIGIIKGINLPQDILINFTRKESVHQRGFPIVEY